MSKVSISISRNSTGKIGMRVVDESSRIEFLDVSIELEAFAEIITGLSFVKCDAEFRGMQYVGKTKVTEKRSAICPIDTYDKEILSKWLLKKKQEDGWIIDTYLGSQGSVGYNQDGVGKLLNYSVYKYVDSEEA